MFVDKLFEIFTKGMLQKRFLLQCITFSTPSLALEVIAMDLLSYFSYLDYLISIEF